MLREDQAGRCFQPRAYLCRPFTGSGEELQGTDASVRTSAIRLDRLRQQADFQGRRGFQPEFKIYPGQPGNEETAGYQIGSGATKHADLAHPQGPGRPALGRWHWHLCEGRQ